MTNGSTSPKRVFSKHQHPAVWVAGLALIVVVILGLSLGSTIRITTQHSPMVDAAMEIKYHAAESHLWLEEAITDGDPADLARFRDHLDQAKWYARAMMEGGEDYHGEFIPLSDPRLRSEIEQVLQTLEQFDSSAMARWSLREESGIGTEVDQRFDVTFQAVIDGASRVELALQQAIGKELHYFWKLQGGLMILVLVLGALVAVVLHVYERQKRIHVRVLQKNEEKLSITLDSIGDGVIAADAEGRITRLNPIAEKLTGWTFDEAVGHPMEEVFHIVNVESRQQVENPGLRALQEGTVVGLANHTVLISRNGTETHIADSASPIYNLDGKIIGVVLVFRDVTERYIKEEAIRKSEKKYRAFFETSADAMLIIEGDEFIDCNAATVRLLGYDEKEKLLNTHPSKLSPETQPDGQPSFEKAEEMMALAREHGGHRFEWMHLRKDGAEIPIEVTLTAIDDEAGIHLHTVWRDLSERKASERAVVENKNRLASILRVAPIGIGVVKERVFQDVNLHMSKITGYSREELVGQSSEMLYQTQGEFLRVGEEKYGQIQEKGTGTVEAQWRRKDGRVIDILLSSTPLNPEDLSVGVTFIALDITEHKRDEEALRASEEKYRGLVETSSDWVWELDAGGNFSYASPQVERILGYKPEELLGKSPYSPMDSDEKERIENLFESMWKNALPIVAMENTNLHKDGHEVILETSATPILNEIGQVTGYRGIDRDVTERKVAEERIKQQQHLLEKAQELGHLGTWELDLKQNQLRWTDETCRIFGVPPGSVVNYEIFVEKVHPDDREYVHREWVAALDGKPYDIEHRLLIDGETKWVREKADIEFDESGAAVRAVGITQDITERKEAEGRLRESAQKLALHVEQTPLAVIGWDTNFEVTEWNLAAESMFGYSRAEALGKHASFIIPDAEREQIDAVLNQLLTNTGGLRSTNENITRAGDHILCEWYNTTLIDSQGDVIGVTSLAMDITARQKAEEERERLMLAIEQTEDIVVITDAEAKIQYVNPAFERATGYSREEAIGQNPRILQSGEHSGTFYKKMWGALTTGRPWSGQLINKKKDGTLYTEKATISPVMDGAGKIINYVAAKRDATHELELEDQLRQAQKMEAVGQMAGGIAHDFNNLLQVISGYVELSEITLKPGDELTPAITEIGKAADRGKGLVTQLLAFSRRQVINPTDLDLNDLIEPLLVMMRGLIGEHIELDFIASRELGTIYADRGLIEQVLMNLCVNARDAMPEGGKLTIETENVLIDGDYARTHTWATPGRYVLLNVTDSGCGMDEVTLERVFEPFFTTKEVGKGTGLGLSTVFGIIKQHNGHINTYSEVDKGTIFKIYLPTVARNAAEVSRKVSGPVVGGTETILVAEDDETVLALAEHMLTVAGYTVLTAKDGKEAIQVFEEHADEIDVVMFDVVMPRLGGKKALERILELRPGLPHLFASGYSENAVHTNFIQKRGLHLLSKPYQTETLLRKLREVLDEE